MRHLDLQLDEAQHLADGYLGHETWDAKGAYWLEAAQGVGFVVSLLEHGSEAQDLDGSGLA